MRSLNLVANLLGALREGDYSIRGLSARSGSSVAMVMREINDLGSTLQRQRTEAVESTALLTHVMEEIGVAVFAFDPANHLLLVNKAGETLVGKSSDELVGRPASALEFDEYLSGEPRRLVDRAFGGRRGRYEVRRAVFYRDGRPHHLVVLADLSQALREQEQAAWQRIVRVLSHEINNSLTPIKSIAHSLRRIVDRAPDLPRTAEVQQGLTLIEERSGALGRFLRSYAQLARLPKPNPRIVDVPELVTRIVELEKRLPVTVHPSPRVKVSADSDQIEQLLINIIRNAVDASLETGGQRVGRVEAGRRLVRDQRRRRRERAARHVQPVRAVLHDETQRLRNRTRAQPPDRRGPRRHDLARKSRRRPRLPGDAEVTDGALTGGWNAPPKSEVRGQN